MFDIIKSTKIKSSLLLVFWRDVQIFFE